MGPEGGMRGEDDVRIIGFRRRLLSLAAGRLRLLGIRTAGRLRLLGIRTAGRLLLRDRRCLAVLDPVVQKPLQTLRW